MKRTIKLNFCDFKNFGDALCPYLIRHLTGCDVVASNVNYADLQAVGSVFYNGGQFFGEKGRFVNRNYVKDVYHRVRNVFLKPMAVWGSGFLWEAPIPSMCVSYRRLEVFAVRGRLTHRLLVERKCGGIREDLAYGDPGLLYRKLMPDLHRIPRSYDLAIVPHYRDKKAVGDFAARLEKQGVWTKLVDVMNPDPFQVLRDIASAEKVLSSSLHGLVVADSLGIPNRQFAADNQEQLKFDDYYSAYDVKSCALDLSDFRFNPLAIMNEIPNSPRVPYDLVLEVSQNLLHSFPRHLGGPKVRELAS